MTDRSVPTVPSLQWLVDHTEACSCATPVPEYPGDAYVTADGRAYRAVPCRTCGYIAGWRLVRTDVALTFIAAARRAERLLAAAPESDVRQIKEACVRLIEAIQDRSIHHS